MMDRLETASAPSALEVAEERLLLIPEVGDAYALQHQEGAGG